MGRAEAEGLCYRSNYTADDRSSDTSLSGKRRVDLEINTTLGRPPKVELDAKMRRAGRCEFVSNDAVESLQTPQLRSPWLKPPSRGASFFVACSNLVLPF